jgi:hypothetical protein
LLAVPESHDSARNTQHCSIGAFRLFPACGADSALSHALSSSFSEEGKFVLLYKHRVMSLKQELGQEEEEQELKKKPPEDSFRLLFH